jgi:hypothetical protein
VAPSHGFNGTFAFRHVCTWSWVSVPDDHDSFMRAGEAATATLTLVCYAQTKVPVAL